ncbi:N-acetylmuramic acid 6-phosphate etherase [Paracoccus sp. M683]|uniref:N-acetylmuramic acid 6-phosphate etherase n=1 Tax=Paracoccus sp. M683 TaxID=2594268 RepID=UPI00117E02E4|nr:N-acetylmuramic acid 6-phosphate etherase [Paracoccus sp. M683]TRW97727.1 N-acetylmuramic acid 6-phosphate etherase [Paracoccus sp. M683]
MPESTETLHAQAVGLHRLPGQQALSRLIEAQIASMGALRPALPQIEAAAERCAAALTAGGRLGFAGAGSSGLMALAERMEMGATFGISPDRTALCYAGGAEALWQMRGGAEDDTALAITDLEAADLAAGDALIAVSASGSTPYTVAIADTARDRGIAVIGIANVAGSPLLDRSDHPVLLETGAEVLAGSTRMAAATAQKVALNAISVLIGIRLGHVHDGHMVNLVAENAKLMRRAAGIVATIAGTGADAASAALTAADGEVKTAILVARGLTPPDARRAILKNGGHLEGLLDENNNRTSRSSRGGRP